MYGRRDEEVHRVLGRSSRTVLLAVVLVSSAYLYGQKATVEYDRSVDFSKFATYTWGELGPIAYPMLRMQIIGSIDEKLAAQGLKKVDTGADMVVVYFGSM